MSARQDGRALPQVAAGDQVGKGATLGLLGNTDVMNAVFNVAAYTDELMRNQNASTVAAVLENEPSV